MKKGVCKLATFLHREYMCGECVDCKKWLKRKQKHIRRKYDR